jgi:hypothetical protein
MCTKHVPICQIPRLLPSPKLLGRTVFLLQATWGAATAAALALAVQAMLCVATVPVCWCKPWTGSPCPCGRAHLRFSSQAMQHLYRYKLAEVTGGGVQLEDLDCRSMESVRCQNLFLCGEICDVFGRIGGFNFYWAWVSGRAAGLGAAGCDWKACEV